MDENTELEELLKPQDENENSENLTDVGELPIEDKVVKLAEANKQLFMRAKKAEAELKAKRESPKEPQAPVPTQKSTLPAESDIQSIVDRRLEERELESLDLEDGTKSKIKAYAKAENVSIKQAMKSEYFDFIKAKEENARKVDEASIGGKHRAPAQKEFSASSPDDFDLTTEEGRKGYEEYKKFRSEKS